MAKPPFTMSKYVNELDLQRDAAKYYQERAEKLEQALEELLKAAVDYVEYTHDGDPWSEDARQMNEEDARQCP